MCNCLYSYVRTLLYKRYFEVILALGNRCIERMHGSSAGIACRLQMKTSALEAGDYCWTSSSANSEKVQSSLPLNWAKGEMCLWLASYPVLRMKYACTRLGVQFSLKIAMCHPFMQKEKFATQKRKYALLPSRRFYGNPFFSSLLPHLYHFAVSKHVALFIAILFP